LIVNVTFVPDVTDVADAYFLISRSYLSLPHVVGDRSLAATDAPEPSADGGTNEADADADRARMPAATTGRIEKRVRRRDRRPLPPALSGVIRNLPPATAAARRATGRA
jgi:hypothetical protein